MSIDRALRLIDGLRRNMIDEYRIPMKRKSRRTSGPQKISIASKVTEREAIDEIV